MDGWIKLHRKLLDNPIFQNENLLQLFIYCLLKANHEPRKIIFNGQEIMIGRGQFITGRETLSAELQKNGISTYKRMKVLEKLDILNIKSNNRFSLVTVVKYEDYQDQEEKRNNQRNNKGTTKEQQGNNGGTQTRTKRTKELKELKELKNVYAEFVTLKPTEYEKLVNDHGQVATDRIIEILNNYKMQNDKKYASDYGAINNWVIKRYHEEQQKQKAPPGKQPAAMATAKISTKGLYEI